MCVILWVLRFSSRCLRYFAPESFKKVTRWELSKDVSIVTGHKSYNDCQIRLQERFALTIPTNLSISRNSMASVKYNLFDVSTISCNFQFKRNFQLEYNARIWLGFTTEYIGEWYFENICNIMHGNNLHDGSLHSVLQWLKILEQWNLNTVENRNSSNAI